MNKLEIRNISKSFGSKKVLKELNLSVEDGKRISILGPSGCGKSTILNIIAGIIDDYDGDVLLNGEVINDRPVNKRNIVVVSQENLLFPHMNVFENIAFSLVVRKEPKEKIEERVNSLLEEINLSGYDNKKVNQLSGGEKQRVALARALASEPEILLLDEAYSSLDPTMREKMRELTISLQENHGITTILVTHDKEEAMMFSDKIAIVLDGKIKDYDVPKKIYSNPKDLDAARFLHRYNFIDLDNESVVFINSEDIEIIKIDEKNSNNTTNYSNLFNIGDNPDFDDNMLYSGEIIDKIYTGVRVRYGVNVDSHYLKIDDFRLVDEYTIGDRVVLKINKYKIYSK